MTAIRGGVGWNTGGGGSGGSGAFWLGPFSVAAIPAGDDPDPSMSEPSLAGYGGLEVFLPALRDGAITGMAVTLSGGAAGSALRAVLVVDAPTDVVVTLAQTERGAVLDLADTPVAVTAGQGLAVAIQVGDTWTGTAIGVSVMLEITRS